MSENKNEKRHLVEMNDQQWDSFKKAVAFNKGGLDYIAHYQPIANRHIWEFWDILHIVSEMDFDAETGMIQDIAHNVYSTNSFQWLVESYEREYDEMEELCKKALENRYFAHDIQWDLDDDAIDDCPQLPNVVLLPENIEIDDDGYSEEVDDYLSNVYGFCVCGYCISKGCDIL